MTVRGSLMSRAPLNRTKNHVLVTWFFFARRYEKQQHLARMHALRDLDALLIFPGLGLKKPVELPSKTG